MAAAGCATAEYRERSREPREPHVVLAPQRGDARDRAPFAHRDVSAPSAKTTSAGAPRSTPCAARVFVGLGRSRPLRAPRGQRQHHLALRDARRRCSPSRSTTASSTSCTSAPTTARSTPCARPTARSSGASQRRRGREEAGARRRDPPLRERVRSALSRSTAAPANKVDGAPHAGPRHGGRGLRGAVVRPDLGLVFQAYSDGHVIAYKRPTAPRGGPRWISRPRPSSPRVATRRATLDVDTTPVLDDGPTAASFTSPATRAASTRSTRRPARASGRTTRRPA